MPNLHVDPEYQLAWQPFSGLPRPEPASAAELRKANNAAIGTVMTLFPHKEHEAHQSTLRYTAADGSTELEMLRFDPPPTPPFPGKGAGMRRAGGSGPTLTTGSSSSSSSSSSGQPAALYIHGGGLVSGSPLLFRKDVTRYARATGLPFFAPAYRLAPEYPYPTPLKDVCSALGHLRNNAAELGIDAARIAVVGVSAGGGLAAALALTEQETARQGGGGGKGAPPRVARLMLLAPMLDDRTWLDEGHPLERHTTWTSQMNTVAWRAYLGRERTAGEKEEGDVPADAAAARAEDVSGFPRTYIDLGGLDLFRDEVLAFGVKLAKANVEIEMHLYPGVPHVWEYVAAEAEVTTRAVENRVKWLRAMRL